MDAKIIQQTLTKAGYDIGLAGVDGILGKDSRKAIAAFQVARNIIGDVGPLTEAALSAMGDDSGDVVLPKNWNFVGPGLKMADADLPRIGSQIGVGEDEIHAFLDAETNGSGFDAQNRPKLLFEPHKFYAKLAGAQRDAAVKAGLAYKTWGEKPYPKESYTRLNAAIAINETAALKSASWGLGQIMGENYVAAGYDSVQDMVHAFVTKGEAEHLHAAINFIIANNLDDELRLHNWAGFARGYNGPGYAKNGYHITLEKRFAFWRTKPDTPWARSPS